eukprot:4089341-Heterocapsa_arctica.AAC.1
MDSPTALFSFATSPRPSQHDHAALNVSQTADGSGITRGGAEICYLGRGECCAEAMRLQVCVSIGRGGG